MRGPNLAPHREGTDAKRVQQLVLSPSAFLSEKVCIASEIVPVVQNALLSIVTPLSQAVNSSDDKELTLCYFVHAWPRGWNC